MIATVTGWMTGSAGRRLRAAGLALALATGHTAGEAHAAPQKAPNSRISLDVPQAFEPADLFAGFVDETRGVSIVVTEMPPAAYEKLVAGFTPETLAGRGIQNVAKGDLARRGDYVYVKGTQSSPSGDYAKFFVAFPAGDLTALVTANVPQASLTKGEVNTAEIEAILASAQADSGTAPRELFGLGYLGPFKQAGSLMGTSRIYSLDGRFGPESNPHVQFFIAPSIDRRPIADLEGFSVKVLADLDAVLDCKVEERRRLTIAGSEGFELVGRGKDQDGTELALYQVLIKGRNGGYYRLVGLASAGDRGRYLPEFRKMAESFRPAE